MSAYRLSLHIMKERLTAGRMMVIWPLLAMFILFSSWGLSDPKCKPTVEYSYRFSIRCDVCVNRIHHFFSNHGSCFDFI